MGSLLPDPVPSLGELARRAWDRWEAGRTIEEVEPGALERDLPPGYQWEDGRVIRRPWWYTAGAWSGKTQSVRVARGLHPTGWPLHPRALWRGEGRTLCRTCAHYRGHPGSHKKCALVERSKRFGTGPAGDLRVKWGACVRHDPKDAP